MWEYRAITDVNNRLPHFIEEVYNRKRLHSALGYRPPVEFEELFYETQPCLYGDDDPWIEKIRDTYRDLVDRFYRENDDIIPPEQYEAAKKDNEYFIS